MAIKSIHLTNFRRFSEKSFNFHSIHNLISGANGVGKTTIREAFCLVFTGTDSLGTKNPRHLIQDGKGEAAVSIVTDKAEIKRTLCKKGSGTIKIKREGVEVSMKQSDVENMLGSSDLFLSVLVPGYFIKLSEQKKHKVLSEVLPDVDRLELLESIVEFPLTETEIKKYDLNKRIDLIANAISADRRNCHRAVARLEGQVSILKNVKEVSEPKEPTELKELPYMKQVCAAWDNHDRALKHWKSIERQRNRQVEDNEDNAEEIQDYAKSLDSFKNTPPILTQLDNSEGIKILAMQLRSIPERPTSLEISSMEVCNSCGQIVGSKHRERIADENKRLIEEYNTELLSVNEFNKPIELEICKLEEEEALSMESVRERKAEIDNARKHHDNLLIKVQKLQPVQVMEIPEEPKPPTDQFNIEALERLENLENEHAVRLTEYNYAKTRRGKAKEELQGYESKINDINVAHDRLRRLENGVKALPVKELRKQMDSLKMPTVEITIGETIDIVKGVIPYSFLSTGNRMRACVEISLMLNNLAKRSPNIIFLDDADLMDNFEFDHKGVQFFVTNVTKDDSLTIGGKR